MICFARQWTKWIIPSPSSKIPPLQFPLISFPPWTFLLRCGQRSTRSTTRCSLSNVVSSKPRLLGVCWPLSWSVRPLSFYSVLLCNPLLIDISISALLPWRSCANQWSFLLCYHNFFQIFLSRLYLMSYHQWKEFEKDQIGAFGQLASCADWMHCMSCRPAGPVS